MIQITKGEAKIVMAHYPNACIAKTRHKRYLEESLRYLILLPGNLEAAEFVRREKERQARVEKRKAAEATANHKEA